jgi:hypothetical protein
MAFQPTGLAAERKNKFAGNLDNGTAPKRGVPPESGMTSPARRLCVWQRFWENGFADLARSAARLITGFNPFRERPPCSRSSPFAVRAEARRRQEQRSLRRLQSIRIALHLERTMPCYQVNTVSLDFQAGDLALLQKAAKVLGLTILDLSSAGRQVRDRRGEVIAALRDNKAVCRPEHVATLNKLRVQYSREIVGHRSRA